MQSTEVPVTSNPQSACGVDMCSTSSTELESGTEEKLSLSKTSQHTAGISQQSKHFVTATSKHPSATLPASRRDSTRPKSDSQITSESGQRARSLAGTDVGLQQESVYGSSSVSAVHSQTSSSDTARSVATVHGRRSSSSSRRGRSGSQDCSSYSSRRSVSSHEQSGSGRGHGDDASERCDRGPSSEGRRCRPESGSKGRPSASRGGEVQRPGQHGDDRVSRREREWELRKYESCGRRPGSRGERREQRGASSTGNVDERKSSEVYSGRETGVDDDLRRLSMDAARTKETEYQPVLTRHVNQLFVRGDNVALVAVLG